MNVAALGHLLGTALGDSTPRDPFSSLMIPITWTEKAKIPNHPKLLERVRKQGGSIIEFQRVWSVIFFCHSGPIYRWVGSKHGRFFQSLSEVLFCFLAG